jgi:glycosidase
MPITPISVKGRKMTEKDLGSYYAVRDYKAVNPEFGTMNDFIALVRKAHDMGFKVITDWVPNHTGLDNKWTERHPNFYEKDTAGKFISPFDWTDVYKLNYNNKELCDSMIDAMKFWITTADIDGFRCDVAEPVPAFFWKNCIRKLKKLKDVFMLAEGNLAWLHEAGFDATYNWNAMSYTRDLYEGKMSASTFIDSLNSNYTRYPANAMRLNFTTNHDENSWNGTEFEKYGDAYKLFAVFTMTYRQSIPLVYNGQEIPNKKRLKFFVKDPIFWSGYEMAPFYEALLKLRKSNSALDTDADYKQINTSESDIFAYIRKKNEKKVLTILNLSGSKKSFTIGDMEAMGIAKNVFTNENMTIKNEQNFSIGPWGYTVLSFE